jgi:AcrR family transcriptional regulator
VARAPGPVRAQAQVAEIQRSRLLAAAVRVCDERGYAETSVADVVGRARMSRRTFYEMFASRDECFVAVLDQTLGLLAPELARIELERLPWRERMRAGLAAILAFLDREPLLARVCVVHALAGGAPVLARREQIVARLVREVDRGRAESARGAGCTELTAEGVVGAVSAIVHARLVRREPLADLRGELTAMIVLPYLGGAAARRERELPVARAGRPRRGPGAGGDGDGGGDGAGAEAGGDGAGRDGDGAEQPYPASAATEDPLEGVPMRVTYRTARVLEGFLEMPGASNRQIAEHAEIPDPGQISKLLRRLQRLGLIANFSGGHALGEPNAWRLTAHGEQVARSIRRHAHGYERQG